MVLIFNESKQRLLKATEQERNWNELCLRTKQNIKIDKRNRNKCVVMESISIYWKFGW